MKKLGLLFLLLWCGITYSQNPFEDYNYNPQIGTLSDGEFIEDFDNDSIVRIGSIMLNVKNNTIISFVVETVKFTEAGAEPSIMSRWFQPDPLANSFPEDSPYVFVKNNPMMYSDPTGMAPETIFKKIGTNETVEVDDGVNKTIEVSDSDFDIAKLFAALTSMTQEMEDGTITVNIGVSQEVADAYGEFYDSVNSYDDVNVANVKDYLFNRPQLSVFPKVLDGVNPLLDFIGTGGGRKVGQMAFKAFTKSNYRHNLKVLTGKLGIGKDAHHIYPKEFRGFFQSKNINIDHAEHLTWWGKSAHRSASSAINKEWRQYIANEGANATREQVMKKGVEITKKYGGL
ncbi:DUF2380 domain-containing protein [Aquimarina algiphila]|uniref:RHS repeat-associated core domain-containing protein n=1 Tax=Aquimarina algiphila TaxID=2047982 RepID=A0A554VEI7_9FLAO|nr:DUF2380 domain-containing protein [Aquimarina algiphila]TSE05419.1 hypothetical protein FOF46_22920 [Aquimarina algiphila]